MKLSSFFDKFTKILLAVGQITEIIQLVLLANSGGTKGPEVKGQLASLKREYLETPDP